MSTYETEKGLSPDKTVLHVNIDLTLDKHEVVQLIEELTNIALRMDE